MTLWIIVALIVGAVVALWIYMGKQPLGKNRRREDFEHGMRSLLILMEDGGSLHVRDRSSGLAFDFVRAEGTNGAATALLQVPRTSQTEAKCSELHEAFVNNGFEARLFKDTDSGMVLEARIPAEDIWAACSGAKGGRAANLLLDVLGVPQDARFDLSLSGHHSARALKRKEDIP